MKNAFILSMKDMFFDKNQFVALDVETANADMSSICSIGLAVFEDNQIVNEYYHLINPLDYFDYVNISIHGITEDDVEDQPTFAQVVNDINKIIADKVVVTHTHFDRAALKRAAEKYNCDLADCEWLDSAAAVRRTWKDFAKSGYGLKNICDYLKYDFKHHNALEDAKAAGYVLTSCLKEHNLSLLEIAKRLRQSIDIENSSSEKAINREGNPEGNLFGETIVFTGALQMLRNEAANLAALAGCNVAQGVTKQTSILVVGDMDVTRLAGHTKSSKHRKAEDLIKKGVNIRIIRETDFNKMLS